MVILDKHALLIIDMINDYLTPGGLLPSLPCRAIIPSIQHVLRFSRHHEMPVLFLNTRLQNAGEPLAGRWGLHAVKGSFGEQVISELQYLPDDHLIHKTGYNAFNGTDLHATLHALGTTEVVITGIHTHVCVLFTAAAAFELGYRVTILEDCVTTTNTENHTSRLSFFASHIGRVIKSDDWIKEVGPVHSVIVSS
ncbi:MAG: cysteine hydrolase [Ignavibacteria bacterium]|nr:cysteine hydrolase [Ignavibacteria bacterium]